MRYITKIQKNISRCPRLHSRKNTSNMLDGSYKSIYKGRSMNFDELREYAAGDDIKFVDWKASSRSRKLLVRQFVAEKKHNIMFVLDTNRRMLADSKGLMEKHELAIMGAGTMAYFVNQNGDDIGAVYSCGNRVNFEPFKTGLGHIEKILEDYHREVTPGNRSDINSALEYIIHNFRRKMIIIIVTDLQGAYRISETNLKRLLVANDIILLNVSDADIGESDMYDMESGSYIADFVLGKKMTDRAAANKAYIERQTDAKLRKYGIASVLLDDEDKLEEKLIDLIDRHKMEKMQNGINS